MAEKLLQIAIDGPAGAGKSTVAKAVARRLGIVYLDTGAMYRAYGLKALRMGTDTLDEAAVGELATHTAVSVAVDGTSQRVLLDGEDVTERIRTNEVSKAASAVSRWPAVRQHMVRLQREIAGRQPVVMDGRDIGTVVLPEAEYKFFVTASVEARACRRQAEMQARGIDRPLEEYIADIADRDRQDSTRAASPLRVAEDAEVVDTTDRTADEVIEYILSKVMERV